MTTANAIRANAAAAAAAAGANAGANAANAAAAATAAASAAAAAFNAAVNAAVLAERAAIVAFLEQRARLTGSWEIAGAAQTIEEGNHNL